MKSLIEAIEFLEYFLKDIIKEKEEEINSTDILLQDRFDAGEVEGLKTATDLVSALVKLYQNSNV